MSLVNDSSHDIAHQSYILPMYMGHAGGVMGKQPARENTKHPALKHWHLQTQRRMEPNTTRRHQGSAFP